MQNSYSKDQDDFGKTKDKFAATASDAIREGEEKMSAITEDGEKKLKDGKKQAKEVIENVEKELKEHPWPVVAGIAASSLLLGFILGISKRH